MTVQALHLSTTPTLCASGNYARGIDANGNATGCTTVSGGGTTSITTYVPPDWCTPDQTTNSPYPTTLSLTNYIRARTMFVKNASGAMYCQFHIPHPLAGTPNANIVLVLDSNDSTAGHTTQFTTSDVVASTTVNVGSLSAAGSQNYTTTSTAYAPVTLTFAVQSTVAADNLLIVKIAAAATGTAPTNDIELADIKLKIDQTL